MGRSSWTIQAAQGGHKGPCKRGDRRAGVRETDVVTEAAVAVLWVPRPGGSPLEAGKGKQEPPHEAPERAQPRCTPSLDFQPGELWDAESVLFQAPELWAVVSASVGRACGWLASYCDSWGSGCGDQVGPEGRCAPMGRVQGATGVWPTLPRHLAWAPTGAAHGNCCFLPCALASSAPG